MVKAKKYVSKKLIIVLAMILAISLCLAGCGDKSNELEPNDQVKNELTMPVSKDINDINVHLYDGDMSAQAMVFEALVNTTDEGITPGLAEKWEISEDGKEYVFHLRKDVKFTDGEPFNAEAVKLNILAVQNNKERHKWLALCSKITGCDVIDEYTVKVTLSEAYYPALSEFALTRPYRMMSPKVFVDGETKDGITAPIGTGAYILSEHVDGQYAVFTANEDYWGGAPAIKKVTFKVMPAGETPLLAMQNGEINFMFAPNTAGMINAEALKALSEDKKFQVKYSGEKSTRFLIANSNPARIISDKNIKKAVWQAINRKEMCNVVFGGLEVPAYVLHNKHVPYCDISLEKREYDVANARRLIESSGWKYDEDKELYVKDGKTLTLEMVYNGSKEINKALCEYIQSNLKDVGIELKPVPADDNSFMNLRTTGQYDLFADNSWGMPYEPVSTITAMYSRSYETAAQNLPDYEKNRELIEKALTSTDKAAIAQYYALILTSLHEDCPFIPLSYSRSVIVAEKDLKNVSFRQIQYEIPFENYSY
ncbi:MAG: nickel ABC transporter substrate-binding protein [Eubacteriales bacterium]